MTDTVGDWLALVDAHYPMVSAASWDRVGLQVGAPDWPVEQVLVTLDVTRAVVREGAQGPSTLILAHHPLLFRPLDRLTPDTAAGAIALEAARHGVAVAAAHTNLDVATDGAGTSDPVAELLGLRDTAPLTAETRDGPMKLVTFVPPEATERVLDALAEVGAGNIGAYERCSFRVRGTGTFRPGPSADPHVGEVGTDNSETEDRLEIEVPRRQVAGVVRALLSAHPYEEVAYDLYPTVAGADRGFGVVGSLPEPLALGEVARRVREDLPAPHLRFAGDRDRVVRRVAVVGGAGESLIGAALAVGAEVLVTGDLKHHVTLDAREQGLALIDAGHHATEVAALPAWMARLEAAREQRGLAAPLVRSAVPTDPWSGDA